MDYIQHLVQLLGQSLVLLSQLVDLLVALCLNGKLLSLGTQLFSQLLDVIVVGLHYIIPFHRMLGQLVFQPQVLTL